MTLILLQCVMCIDYGISTRATPLAILKLSSAEVMLKDRFRSTAAVDCSQIYEISDRMQSKLRALVGHEDFALHATTGMAMAGAEYLSCLLQRVACSSEI